MYCAHEQGRQCWAQESVRVGAECWVLHPAYGTRPVAEGIAGSTPHPKNTDISICRSLLATLCEDGQQTVKVTKLHRKYTELMFPDEDASAFYLDDYLSPPRA